MHTLDEYTIQELLELPAEQLLAVRRFTVDFILRSLDPAGMLSKRDTKLMQYEGPRDE